MDEIVPSAATNAEAEEPKADGGIQPPPELLAPPLRAPDTVPMEPEPVRVEPDMVDTVKIGSLMAAPPPPVPVEAPTPPVKAPPKAASPRRPRRVPVNTTHLALSFMSGLGIVLGIAGLLMALFMLLNPPDTKVLRDLADVPNGERIRLGELTVESQSAGNPYNIPAPMLTLRDNGGNRIELLNTWNATLPVGSQVYGLSVRAMKSGHITILEDAYNQETDPIPTAIGAAVSLILGIVCLVALRRMLA